MAVQRELFDLVLMDLHMPEMDGLETTRRIRQDPRQGEIPIIAMTAAVMEKDRADCAAAGMNDHVGKPIVQEELIKALVKWIKPLEAKAEVTSTPPTTGDGGKLPADLPGFDLAGAMQRMKISPTLFRQLLHEAQAEFRTDAEKMTQRITEGNLAAAIDLAHRIKGSAGTLGAVTLAAEAARLESALAQPGGEVKMEAFQRALQQVLTSLAAL